MKTGWTILLLLSSAVDTNGNICSTCISTDFTKEENCELNPDNPTSPDYPNVNYATTIDQCVKICKSCPCSRIKHGFQGDHEVCVHFPNEPLSCSPSTNFTSARPCSAVDQCVKQVLNVPVSNCANASPCSRACGGGWKYCPDNCPAGDFNAPGCIVFCNRQPCVSETYINPLDDPFYDTPMTPCAIIQDGNTAPIMEIDMKKKACNDQKKILYDMNKTVKFLREYFYNYVLGPKLFLDYSKSGHIKNRRDADETCNDSSELVFRVGNLTNDATYLHDLMGGQQVEEFRNKVALLHRDVLNATAYTCSGSNRRKKRGTSALPGSPRTRNKDDIICVAEHLGGCSNSFEIGRELYDDTRGWNGKEVVDSTKINESKPNSIPTDYTVNDCYNICKNERQKKMPNGKTQSCDGFRTEWIGTAIPYCRTYSGECDKGPHKKLERAYYKLENCVTRAEREAKLKQILDDLTCNLDILWATSMQKEFTKKDCANCSEKVCQCPVRENQKALTKKYSCDQFCGLNAQCPEYRRLFENSETNV